ncbi:hypothetical protein [Bosea sp. 2RAB26]|uniref:hypothetical protein n=1 Tax=Bosea sp. 2RAB26 TaxID=3237476 RepID=UPI003F8DE2FB
MTPDECSTELHLREITGHCDPEYRVIFMGENVGRIIRDSSRNDPKCWSWIIQIGHAWPNQFNDYEISLEAAKAAFRAAWLPAFDAVTLEQFNAKLKANHDADERTRFWQERHGRRPKTPLEN